MNNYDLRNLRMMKLNGNMNCIYPSFVIGHCYFLKSKIYNAKGHQCLVSVEC